MKASDVHMHCNKLSSKTSKHFWTVEPMPWCGLCQASANFSTFWLQWELGKLTTKSHIDHEAYVEVEIVVTFV